MNEEMSLIISIAKEKMEQAIEHLEKEFLNIRAGKANPVNAFWSEGGLLRDINPS